MSRIEVVAPIAGTFRNPADSADGPGVAVGSAVHVGTPVGRIEADGTAVPINADVAGVVTALAAGDGDVVAVGQALVIIDTH